LRGRVLLERALGILEKTMTNHPNVILVVDLRLERDIVTVRQRAREIASLVGFDQHDQTRISTAASEIARNAYTYAGGGRVEFSFDKASMERQGLLITISDEGAGIVNLSAILEGRFHSKTGLGKGILGAKRLMDVFEIRSEPGAGTTVRLEKFLPPGSPPVTASTAARMAEEIGKGAPRDPFVEVRHQNQELLRALQEVQTREAELARLHAILQRESDEAIRIREARLQGIISSAMDAIISVDEQRRIVVFNAAAEKTFLCPVSEALGSSFDRFAPEPFREIYRECIREFEVSGISARPMSSPHGLTARRSNGEEFPIEATISRVQVAGEKLFTIILRDIKERKRSEEIARLYIRNQELDRLKTEFFANISHELRTPLALILGPVRKWLAGGELNGAERRDLELVERNARLLLRQVNDLLDLSKLDAGKMRAEYAGADLARLGRLVASNFESLASELGLRYEVEIPGSLSAQFDPAKIERVLLNLLSNAFKFTPGGGRVRFAMRKADDHAVVEVEDSGPGILPHLREIIFERFRQLESGTNRQFGGTGLGLSIAKQFVSLHDGSITVGEGADGSGSLFRVELPLLAREASQVQATVEEFDTEAARQAAKELAVRTPTQPATGGALAENAPTVLVVEDNPDMNAFLAETLSASYRVVAAFDGREGLERAVELRPELILCDIMMPGMSGDQMIRELRQRPELDDVPIVVLTAKADDQLLAQLLKEGAQDYLQKPFAAEQLLAKLERLIADRRAVAQELVRLRQVSGRLLQADDQERRAIAHELHENVAQYMAVLDMKLVEARKVAVSPRVHRVLAEGASLLELCCSEIRTMAYALHPSELEFFGLESAIESHVNSFVQRSGIEVKLDVPPGLGRLPAGLELTLFRIMQEALNDIRDGGGKKAWVRMYRNAEEVGLEVSECRAADVSREEQTLGRGLQSAGITAMRERVRVLGGRLDFSSAGNRSVVKAVLPVNCNSSDLI
jgi:PAS domain S-box-containing protein